MENLNFLSIVLAALTPMIIGFIYYHKALFGKAWMDSLGLTDEKIKEANMVVTMVVSLIMSALVAMFLVNFCNGPGQEGEFDTFQHGAFHGAIISILFVVPIFITNGLFEQKSWKNMLINSGYWIITLTLMGGIVDAMNHFPNM